MTKIFIKCVYLKRFCSKHRCTTVFFKVKTRNLFCQTTIDIREEIRKMDDVWSLMLSVTMDFNLFPKNVFMD
ncbi:hypothetical protein CDAR_575681 [Caerostris darwini]|uniref:Uncharacterized protein n=1 Tax=Caerostris darwini TaxID=1538125 RepID=A0AAV4MSU3_9ARAC|nr:hypothetical protein CDAR_575681 [Caerostris darwini]